MRLGDGGGIKEKNGGICLSWQVKRLCHIPSTSPEVRRSPSGIYQNLFKTLSDIGNLAPPHPLTIWSITTSVLDADQVSGQLDAAGLNSWGGGVQRDTLIFSLPRERGELMPETAIPVPERPILVKYIQTICILTALQAHVGSITCYAIPGSQPHCLDQSRILSSPA